MKKRNESFRHLRGKILSDVLFTLLGWLTLFEELLCDVLAWKVSPVGRTRTLGIEVECSAINRHVVHNATRDLTNGCDAVLTIVGDDITREKVRRLLKESLPRDLWTRIGVLTVSQVEQQIQRRQTCAQPESAPNRHRAPVLSDDNSATFSLSDTVFNQSPIFRSVQTGGASGKAKPSPAKERKIQ